MIFKFEWCGAVACSTKHQLWLYYNGNYIFISWHLGTVKWANIPHPQHRRIQDAVSTRSTRYTLHADRARGGNRERDKGKEFDGDRHTLSSTGTFQGDSACIQLYIVLLHAICAAPTLVRPTRLRFIEPKWNSGKRTTPMESDAANDKRAATLSPFMHENEIH